MTKRLLDIAISGLAILILIPLFIAIGVMIRLDSKGPVIYWSNRVGRNNRLFSMPKFRTMIVGSPVVATHLIGQPENYLTGIGGCLRRTSLDELPQLFSIFLGHMSLVGPRPALFNQDDLVALRTERGIHRVQPGLTGWAQINGRDELPIPEKVALDHYYIIHQSLFLDLKILCLTTLKVFGGHGVSH